MAIPSSEWLIYETQWRVSIHKHNYDAEYALNLMNQTWISLTEQTETPLDSIINAIKFIDIWKQILIPIKNGVGETYEEINSISKTTIQD